MYYKNFVTRWFRPLVVFFVVFAIGGIAILTVALSTTHECHNGLNGVFTNGISADSSSFISIEFRDDRFISTVNVPLTQGVSEYFADRVELSECGYYFIRVVQRGNFSISNEVYTEGLTKIFPGGYIRHLQFSYTGNIIYIGQSRLYRSN